MSPNLFVLGFPKAGTTTLAKGLGGHEEIFLPSVKEPLYWCQPEFQRFGHEPIWDSCTHYEGLYVSGANCRYRLDASTRYVFSRHAIERILQEYGETGRFILMVRDPAQMVVSYHSELRKTFAVEHDRFADEWRQQELRRPSSRAIDYRWVGKVADHVSRVEAIVPSEQLLVLPLTLLASSTAEFAERISSFLDIDIAPAVFSIARNPSSVARFSMLRRCALTPPRVLEESMLAIRGVYSRLPERLRNSMYRKDAPDLVDEATLLDVNSYFSDQFQMLSARGLV